MKVQELRIGNYYKWYADGKEYYFKVDNSFFGDINVINNAEPIELTEEILLKCGFVTRGSFWFDLHLDEKTKLTIGWHLDGRVYFEITINKIYFDISHIKYLHQLQNLYFALTNEELNIEL